MPTVPSQTEADHFYRAVEALILSLLGTLLVLLSIPALTQNYLWTTLAAIGSVCVVIPAILAVRRARRKTSPEPTLQHKRTARMIGILNLLLGVLIVAVAWAFPHSGHAALTMHAICVVIGLYLLPVAFVIEFVPYYFMAVAVLLASFVPMHIYGHATGSVVAGLVTGLLLWVAAFLVFSRTSQ